MDDLQMPAADVIAESRRREYPAKQFYYVSTQPTGGMGPVMERLDEHLAFQEELERRGVLLAAGPLFTQDGLAWTGEGMVVLIADSLEQAIEIASHDPMHVSGARTFSVRPWLVNEGSVAQGKHSSIR